MMKKYNEIHKIGVDKPFASDLIIGGYAIDIRNKKMYIKKSDGSISYVGNTIAELEAMVASFGLFAPIDHEHPGNYLGLHDTAVNTNTLETYSKEDFALLQGNSSEEFQVAEATSDNHAIQKIQAEVYLADAIASIPQPAPTTNHHTFVGDVDLPSTTLPTATYSYSESNLANLDIYSVFISCKTQTIRVNVEHSVTGYFDGERSITIMKNDVIIVEENSTNIGDFTTPIQPEIPVVLGDIITVEINKGYYNPRVLPGTAIINWKYEAV